MERVALLVGFVAATVISVWALVDKRVPRWLPAATLGVPFIGAYFVWTTQYGWVRWAMLAAGVSNLASAVVQYVRARKARQLP